MGHPGVDPSLWPISAIQTTRTLRSGLRRTVRSGPTRRGRRCTACAVSGEVSDGCGRLFPGLLSVGEPQSPKSVSETTSESAAYSGGSAIPPGPPGP